MLRIVANGVVTAAAVATLLWFVGFSLAPRLLGEAPDLYRGADLSFELPMGWRCILDGTEWVCQLEDGNLKKTAIIVFARKRRAVGMDSLDVYEEHLRAQPADVTDREGKAHKAKTVYVRRVRQGPHTWVDARQFNSEIPNYYTRYLASVTAENGILVTYSVHKDHVDDVEPALQRAFESLRFHGRN